MKQVTFTTRDTPETVIAFYKTELQRAGWEFEEQEGNTFFSFEEASALPMYSLGLYVNPEEQATIVEIVFSYAPCTKRV